MPIYRIVRGQRVDPIKVRLAKELRRRMTKEEAILWKRLRNNRFMGLQFRRQQIIDRFIVDFYCHATALVVEVDGWVHSEQVEYDADRDETLEGLGLTVLRFTNDEVNTDLAGVLARIAAHCQEALDPSRRVENHRA